MIGIGTKVACSYDGGIYEIVSAIKQSGKDFPDGYVYLIKNENTEFWTNSPMLSLDTENKKKTWEQMRLF